MTTKTRSEQYMEARKAAYDASEINNINYAINRLIFSDSIRKDLEKQADELYSR
jgi:hypothetical protein